MKRIFILIITILTCCTVAAQVTLDDCQKLARANYPEIRQYDLISQTQGFTIENIRKAYLPQLTLSAQATLQSAVPSYPEALTKMMTAQGMSITGMNKDQYKIQLEASQLIWDGGKTAASQKIAETESATQALQADVDLYSLSSRIDELYFGIILLESQKVQTTQTMDLLQANLDKITSLVENGAAMQSDADAVEAELLSVRQRLTQLQTSEDSYRKILSLFTGKDLSKEELTIPQANEPDTFETNRPELTLLDTRSANLAAQKRLIQASTLPTFGLFAQGYYGYPGMDYFKSMMNSDWSLNGIIGIRMLWNISALYTKKSSIARLDASSQMLDVQKDVFLFNNRLQSTQESQDIQSLRKILSDDDKIVELRRKVRMAAESQLRNGVIDSSSLLEKITAENNAAIARSSREIELLKAIYELKHTVNR